jgi:hypothetical protein
MRGKLFLLGYVFLLAFTNSVAQYAIIPKPLLSIGHKGYFTFSSNYQIDCLSRDSFLNSNLKHWVQTEAIKKIAVNKTVQTKLQIQIIGSKKWKQYLKKLQLNSLFDPSAEGYVIKIEKNNILLLAQTETGLFYGFQTIKQLFNLNQIQAGIIYDKPSIAIRAWQDDISRGPIPTMEQLKLEIKTLSHYKLNYFTLYTEHVFKYRKHPSIAPVDGITAAEIKELQRYASNYHVTLIANQQSFGHMGKILANTAYNKLGEKDHILSPANEDTYSLLKDFYQEQNEVYGGNYFHINADETFGLGSGQNKKMADSMGIGNLYAYHINRLYKLLKPSGKKVVMWSDIIASYPQIKSKLPKDIILVPWAYHEAENFKSMLEPIVKAGFDFWVAPGVNNWLNLYPNQEVAKNNIYNLIRDGYHLGAKGVLNTSWDDDGFALFANNWQGFIWGAELSWNAPLANSLSNERWHNFIIAFDQQFWGVAMSNYANQFANLHQGKVKKLLHNATFFEPIFPLHSDYIGKEVELANINAIAELALIYKKVDSLLIYVKPNNKTGENLKYAMRETQFSLEKNLFRSHYASFVLNQYSKAILLEELDRLKQKLVNLKQDFTYLYLNENRNWWLANNLQKFDQTLLYLSQITSHCIITPSEKISSKGREITLSSPLSNDPIYYTLDKTTPNIKSKIYKKPIYAKEDIQVNCAALNLTQETINISSDSFIYHKAIGKIERINIPYSKYHPAYSGGGMMALVDGKLGDKKDIKSGRWQGYTGSDLVIDLNFDATIKMSDFAMSFYQNTPSWVILPKELKLVFSEDGKNYSTDTCFINHKIPATTDEIVSYSFTTKFKKKPVIKLRIICKYYGPLPMGHSGEGYPSMIFADEIIVK